MLLEGQLLDPLAQLETLERTDQMALMVVLALMEDKDPLDLQAHLALRDQLDLPE